MSKWDRQSRATSDFILFHPWISLFIWLPIFGGFLAFDIWMWTLGGYSWIGGIILLLFVIGSFLRVLECIKSIAYNSKNHDTNKDN